ncbi:hypothetical protein [Plastoroseomonas hellenica]|uniref:hypothetical protein n=1 Tax=Plastoroseomonas hellenica TaxID=2687306 RepID=UPI001BA99AD4|nr:hypothetical protein [Plastoroseomonas hellenica]MBR0647557.1 hypothetical protein [Plastoroseomonas hellenica]
MTEGEARLLAKLERAVAEDGGMTTLADVVAAIREGRAQFWQQGDTVAVTEMLRYPRGLALRHWLAAGNIHEGCALLPAIEDWARERGARRAEALGRKGWARLARRHGYAPRATLYVKEL